MTHQSRSENLNSGIGSPPRAPRLCLRSTRAMFRMGAMSASSKVLLRRSLAGSSSAPRRAAAARRAVVVSANGANSVDASRGSAYDCECCPPGSPFLFRLPNTRLSSVSTRSAASSSPRVLASAVPSDVPSAAEQSQHAFHVGSSGEKPRTCASLATTSVSMNVAVEPSHSRLLGSSPLSTMHSRTSERGVLPHRGAVLGGGASLQQVT